MPNRRRRDAVVKRLAGRANWTRTRKIVTSDPELDDLNSMILVGAASLALLLAGPGRFSIDRLLVSRRSRSRRPVQAPTGNCTRATPEAGTQHGTRRPVGAT